MRIALSLCISATICIFSCKKNDTHQADYCPEAYVLNTADIQSLNYEFNNHVGNYEPLQPIYFFPQNNLIGKPVFNPSNDYEFIFLKKRIPQTQSPIEELWKYNFCSNAFTLLTSGLDEHKSVIDWSIQDWILYSSESKIYKMKSSGDSVTYLTENPGYFDLAWNPLGDKFAGYNAGSQMVSVFNHNGMLLKEYALYTAFSTLYWVNASEILFVNHDGVFLINTVTDNVSPLCNGFDYTPVGFTRNTAELFVMNMTMFGRLNVNTCQIDSIMPVYRNKSYFDVRKADNDKLISTLVVTQWKDSLLNQVNQFYHFVLMDSNGDNQRIIPLN